LGNVTTETKWMEPVDDWSVYIGMAHQKPPLRLRAQAEKN